MGMLDQMKDSFYYFHHGLQVNESVYLCGDDHLYVFDLKKNKAEGENYKGFKSLNDYWSSIKKNKRRFWNFKESNALN